MESIKGLSVSLIGKIYVQDEMPDLLVWNTKCTIT